MESTLRVLRGFKKILDGYGVVRCRAVATSAVREAENRDSFLDRVRLRTGFDVEVIDGPEENRLTYMAVRDVLSQHPMLNIGNICRGAAVEAPTSRLRGRGSLHLGNTIRSIAAANPRSCRGTPSGESSPQATHHNVIETSTREASQDATTSLRWGDARLAHRGCRAPRKRAREYASSATIPGLLRKARGERRRRAVDRFLSAALGCRDARSRLLTYAEILSASSAKRYRPETRCAPGCYGQSPR